MAKLWDDYGKGSFRNKVGTTKGIAADVLSVCGIPQAMHDDPGGTLPGVDIKRMDAMSAIKASLFERVVDNKLLELIVDKDGNAVIKEVGADSSKVSDLYYTTQAYAYKNDNVAVMVTGGVPLPERRIGQFTELLSSEFDVMYWAADIVNSACAMQSLKRYVTITYDDPHFTSSYEDGIDNLYEVTDPFETVIGYVYDVDYGTADPYVEITFSNKATVPIRVNGFGTLAITALAAGEYTNEDSECQRGLGSITECGPGAVTVEIPDELRYTDNFLNPVDKFLGVAGVYVVGYKVAVGYLPTSESESMNTPGESNIKLWVVPEDTTRDIVKLTEGKNYAVAYDGENVCIQFADRSPLDMQGICGAAMEVRIPSWSAKSDAFTQTVDILPISETEALVVQEIWATIDVASPCINIFDPKGTAMDIAKSMSIKVAPITMLKEPAPVAVNGNSINLDDGMEDHDPTTTQGFSKSEMEDAMDGMNGSVGMNVNMSCFISKGDVASFSENLKALYEGDNGVVTIYLCGPDAEAEIGDSTPDGGVVNGIEYRYNDSASYTVSVTSGPKFASNFVASVGGGTYVKKDESVTLEGVVVADYGNGGHYDVLLEGLGRREALNSTMDVIRVGDIVSVTVHNNPVES
jgi:hypothetical protein